MGPKTMQRVSTFKIFVSSLPNGLKNEDVGKLFEPYGRVVESEVFKGNFAFVHMEDDSNGRQAIQELNGKELDGSVLSVVQSKNIQGPKIATMKLAVKNIPQDGLTPADLRSLFTKYGYILEAEIRGNQGHVLIEATGDIRSAINEVNGYQIQDQALKVEAVTNYTSTSSRSDSSSAPPKPKLGRRKEMGPYDRKPGPPAFMPPPNFSSYPGPGSRRPGPPPPMSRPGGMGGGPRPFLGPPRQDFSQDYSYEEGPQGGYYGNDGYDQDFKAQPYYNASPRRPPQPQNFRQNDYSNSYDNYEQDQPYYGGRNHPPPQRVPRNRADVKPLFNDEPYFQGNDGYAPGPARNLNTEFYDDYEIPPSRPTNNSFGGPPQGNRQQPRPLMAEQAPVQNLQNLMNRTAKVTKFGKIVVNGDDEKPALPRKRGVRGGVQARAKRAAREGRLPSLMEAIPGTVTPVGGQTYSVGYGSEPAQAAPPLMGISSSAKAPRPLMQFHQHQQRPGPPAVRAPNGGAPARPLMRPPRPPPHAANSQPQSLLALYHDSKRQPPMPMQQMMPMPPHKLDIDFTADIDIA